MRAHAIAVSLEQSPALRSGRCAALAESRIMQHLPDRHPGRLQALEKGHPGQDGRIVVALSGPVAGGAGNETDPFVVAQRVRRQPGPLREFADLHDRTVLVTTQE